MDEHTHPLHDMSELAPEGECPACDLLRRAEFRAKLKSLILIPPTHQG